MRKPMEPFYAVVEPGQCNQLGHMKVEHYFAAVSELTHSAMIELGLESGDTDQPQMSFAVVHAETDFKAGLVAGDEFRLSFGVASIGTKSATFTYLMERVSDGVVAFETSFKTALIGNDDGKAHEIPGDIRQALEELQG
ncbi:MAG: hypothetical protein HOL85_02440 [Rhodospirillaceae bacterium]|nr:hypothetical protein [Rhodospirillaceae bacterium]